MDNILLLQELDEQYHMGRGPPHSILKVDLQKAYDSVNWSFIFLSGFDLVKTTYLGFVDDLMIFSHFDYHCEIPLRLKRGTKHFL